MVKHEGPDAWARCEIRYRCQRQGTGPESDEDPRPPTSSWVRSPNDTRQRKPSKDEPPRHPGPPTSRGSGTLGEEAARKRWHARIGMIGALAMQVRNAQATGASEANGVRTVVCTVPRGHDVESACSRELSPDRRPRDALRCPSPQRRLPAGPRTLFPCRWTTVTNCGRLETMFPLHPARSIAATTRAMAASLLTPTSKVTTARPLPSRRQWPTVFDPHRIRNVASCGVSRPTSRSTTWVAERFEVRLVAASSMARPITATASKASATAMSSA